MADALGRNPGEPGYDSNSETDPEAAQATNANYDVSGAGTYGGAQTPPNQPASTYSQQNISGTGYVTPGQPGPLPALPDGSRDTAIQAAYKQYLGRTASQSDLQSWEGNDNFAAGIQGSPEAQAYAAKNGGGAGTFDGSLPSITAALQAGGFTNDDPNYWLTRIQQTGGMTPDNLAYWQKRIAAGPAGGQPGGAYYDPGAAGGGSSSSSSVQTGGPYNAQIGDEIGKLLGDANSPTDATDPNIAKPVQAFKNQVSYWADRNREKLAEQAAQEGMGSGAFDTAIQSELEKGSLDTASYEGQLTQSEIARKMDEIKTALSTASGSNAQSLQLQLAQLNDQLSRAQMGQQNSQFYDNLSARLGEQSNSLDAELLKYLTA